jgi:hypothetical protein
LLRVIRFSFCLRLWIWRVELWFSIRTTQGQEAGGSSFDFWGFNLFPPAIFRLFLLASHVNSGPGLVPSSKCPDSLGPSR